MRISPFILLVACISTAAEGAETNAIPAPDHVSLLAMGIGGLLIGHYFSSKGKSSKRGAKKAVEDKD